MTDASLNHLWSQLSSILLYAYIKIYLPIHLLIHLTEYFLFFFFYKNNAFRASLVVQWLRICLPMQGTWVRTLVWEDPTYRGATKPVRHNY